MATFVPELNPVPNTKQLCAVRIRIIINRVPKRASLNFRIKANQWDAKKQRVKDNHQQHALYNQLIRDKLDQAEKYYLTHPEATAEEIQLHIERSKPTDGIPLERALINAANDHRNKRTAAYYLTTARMSKECLGEITLERLGIDGVKKYERYLFDRGLKVNTVHRHLKVIRTVIRKAIKQRELSADKNPFLYMTIKTESTTKEKLTLDELKKFESASLNGWECKARDIFMFCFYTGGTRIGDVLQLTTDNLKSDRLVYRMGKTGNTKSVKLTDKALALIKKYEVGKKLFPFASDGERGIDSGISIINKFLKKAAKRVGIEKNISTHVARHTFADLARKKTKDIYAIQQALGHSSIKVTEGYLRSLDTSTSDNLIDEATTLS